MTANHIEDRRPWSFAARTVALAGAALTALLSASCCIIPIGLTIVGLGGAWLSFLGPFATHRELILLVTTAVVGLLWLRMFRRVKHRPSAHLFSPGTIIATLAVAIAWSAPLWEAQVTGALLDIWANQR